MANSELKRKGSTFWETCREAPGGEGPADSRFSCRESPLRLHSWGAQDSPQDHVCTEIPVLSKLYPVVR